MRHFFQEIALKTRAPIEFVDITGEVRAALEKSGVHDGGVTVFTRHTTTAIKINERCGRLQDDMIKFLGSIVPSSDYTHDLSTSDARPNARGHLMSLLLNASEMIPVADGRLLLGEWQSVFFVELDGPREKRSVVVNVIGE